MSGGESEMGRFQGDAEFWTWLKDTHGLPVKPDAADLDAADLDAARAHVNTPAETYRLAQANKMLRLWREFRERSK